MNLNILLRGQSNAQLMGSYNGGLQHMAEKVEALLGFDGVSDKINLEFSSYGDHGNTVFSGTSFLTEWLEAKNGDWRNGWTAQGREQSLLDFVDHLSPAQKAEPTAVVWLHSEYDSSNRNLSPAEFASGVRFDAGLVRQAFGQSATTLPYLFVSAIPYSSGTDQGHQAIRTAMEDLSADPAFNGRIAARALDTDMSFQDVTGDGVNDFGGPHQSDPDGLQTADRVAQSLAQTWAQFAKPGSPVALAGGAVDDLGPRVVQGTLVGTNQVAVKVALDAAHGLAPLDADAAAGIGWSVVGSRAETAIQSQSAVLTGGDTLLLTFGSAIPAGAKLYYGYGYGRLAGADGSGRGNAVYDDAGMPVWVDAHGLSIGGVSSLAPAAATALPPAQFGNAGNGFNQGDQVASGTLTYAQSAFQTFAGKSAWGTLDGVSFTPGTWDPAWSTHLAFDNLPKVDLDLRAAGATPLDILAVAAREGHVTLGDGSDHVTWVAHSDSSGTGNTMVISTGGGNDTVDITAVGLSTLAEYDRTGNGSRFGQGYDGRESTAEIHIGSGAATVSTAGLVRLEVFGGDSPSVVAGGGRGDTFWIGSGGGIYAGGAGGDDWVFAPGSGHTGITDFTPGEDRLAFVGETAANITTSPAIEGGISGVSVVFDAAGHSVFLAGISAVGPNDIVFV